MPDVNLISGQFISLDSQKAIFFSSPEIVKLILLPIMPEGGIALVE